MKLNKKWFAPLLLSVSMLLTSTASIAQIRQAAASTDTGKVFALSDLQELVFRYHPVMKQAGLLSESARAVVLQSLGYFDPALKAGFGQKVFGNTDYYNNWNSELKVPLWLAGADLKVGYDRSVGTYTNPETRTPMPGLAGVGLSIPLGQGLIIDARRNTLRQSKIMVQYAEAEQVKQINATWYDIAKDYWAWYYAYKQYQLVNEGVQLAQRRFDALARQTVLGDKPSIDSVEAYITVQERIIQKTKSAIELQNASLVLSNHLWSEQGNPMELPANARPQDIPGAIAKPNQIMLDSLMGNATNIHPELLKLRSKGSQLAIERSYRQEVLKPKLNISGTLISTRTSFDGYVPSYYDFNRNNYKFGFDFAFPLFLRSERGKLREVKLKQLDNDYDLQQTGREINTNIRSAYNDLSAYADQLTVQVQSINNQQTLLRGESQKFELGESTLFLINSRETKLIDMKIKRESMVAGYQKTLAELYYKAGTRQNAF
ncbi:TolC family protein [Mucilaginibacter myungsuensis]|uniref:TolC family protein n=1 Tax=Mucilaginibacter myungsuensis TaxID=649104 RepID=A0A929KY23_9SPHI|nr:TolC family protein [Mucilaginibacter myungsuensis]MBE9663776.1 TolC family protein [Mucilaginibacter myungsuensis]MDN3598510.1 TolC family protein [Mucilaginibacter myungsuensis]